MTLHDDLYPLFLIEYDGTGKLKTNKRTIDCNVEFCNLLVTVVKRACLEQREVRIVSANNQLVVHAKWGGLVYPDQQDIMSSRL